MDIEKIRADFPILKRKVNGKPLIYFDNNATSQKPKAVIDALVNFYSDSNANVQRGLHKLSEEATEAYEGAREKVAAFINADPREIVFVRNTTEAINLVAHSLGADLKKGDRIISTIMEHHSNIVPWQALQKRLGIDLKFVDINDDGTLKLEMYDEFLPARLVTLTHASNVLGTINPVEKISRRAKKAGALVLVDGAQSTPHMPIDVKALGCDFFTFSAHKMLGPTGVGVLWGRRELLEQMEPLLYGGDMIREVRLGGTTFNEVPWKFEAGTPNIADTIAFGAAIDYLQGIGMQNIRAHEKELVAHALGALKKIPSLEVYGPSNPEIRGGSLAFNVRGAHAHDVAAILDSEGIAIRSGHACAQPLMERLGIPAVARASFYIYNTTQEVDAMVAAIKKVKQMFGLDKKLEMEA